MAQVWIREFDAKNKFFEKIWEIYKWQKIKSVEDLDYINFDENIVIKPDMLFWKRWKYNLVWVNLNKIEAKKWLEGRIWKEIEIESNWKKIKWKLDTFIVEPFVKHNEEYYISFDSDRNWDIIRFSECWWIDIEENWEKVKEIIIPVNEDISDTKIEKYFWVQNNKIKYIITKLFIFFREFWSTYLEVNPFCFDEKWNVVILDMVCKIDDCCYYLQKENWQWIEFPNWFWYTETESEKQIEKLDRWTWASLKFKILNPDAKIWTLLSWWWWSLVITDTIWSLWFTDELWNYWECSWNPDKDSTREYTKIILEEMLRNNKKWKYLIIWWAIANFTHIDKTFQWIIEALEIYKDKLIKQDVKILCRRWWINDKKWLKILEKACKDMKIPVSIADSTEYMTNILKEIKL